RQPDEVGKSRGRVARVGRRRRHRDGGRLRGRGGRRNARRGRAACGRDADQRDRDGESRLQGTVPLTAQARDAIRIVPSGSGVKRTRIASASSCRLISASDTVYAGAGPWPPRNGCQKSSKSLKTMSTVIGSNSTS